MPISAPGRNDKRQEIAKKDYGTDWDDLWIVDKDVIDRQIDATIPEEDRFKGADGYLWKDKSEAETQLIDVSNTLAEKYLSGTKIDQPDYNPEAAKIKLGDASSIYRKRMFGTWSPRTGRYVDGVYNELYPGDQEQEPPEEDTPRYWGW